MKNKKSNYIPEIMYEDTRSGEASTFPFIQVPKDESMPSYLMIFEYKDTGEIEPGPKGEEVSIVDQIPHQFVDLNFLKSRLNEDLFDKVRVCLGMLPLKEASKLGQEKLDKVYSMIEKLKEKKDK